MIFCFGGSWKIGGAKVALIRLRVAHKEHTSVWVTSRLSPYVCLAGFSMCLKSTELCFPGMYADVTLPLRGRNKGDCKGHSSTQVFSSFIKMIAWFTIWLQTHGVFYNTIISDESLQLKSWNYGQSSMSITRYWVDPVIRAVAYQLIRRNFLNILLIFRVILILLCP